MTPDRKFQKARADQGRPAKPSRRWYRMAAWKRKAKRQLDDEPCCRRCAELDPPRVRAATTADHVEPHREDYQAFWHGELQSLCTPCHSGPKQSEERRGYRPGVGDDGWPSDPKHPFNRGGPI